MKSAQTSTSPTCSTCLKSNATFICGLCQQSVCKKCAQFLDPDAFAFLEQKPGITAHNTFCRSCFDLQVVPEINAYEQTMEDARNIHVFFKGQGKEIKALNIQRPDLLLEVKDCVDHNETVLRLAFLAAKRKYNVILDVETQSEKVHDGSYHTLKWHGKGIPAHGEPDKLNRTIDPKFTKWS